ncbi:MAG: hypothetical protein EXR27_07040 [Betaproteobacteria bacterium]|nr:hypothetical protein [Betaproteobacteria bacterium]
MGFSFARAVALLMAFTAMPAAVAGDFRSVAESGTILYDAPSLRAKKIFVASRYYPVEIVVSIEGWAKVRDPAGDLSWIERKALSEKRTVVVTAGQAEVRQNPDDTAAVVFQAQKGVALEVAELGTTGWIRVKHRDGQSGFVRIRQLWGL